MTLEELDRYCSSIDIAVAKIDKMLVEWESHRKQKGLTGGSYDGKSKDHV